MRKLIIAIDGPVGSGKSTIARRVAETLGYVHLDSGAMYRAVAWRALRDGVPLDSPADLEALASRVRVELAPRDSRQCVLVDGEDVTALIRTAEVSRAASVVATVPGVRRPMVEAQRRLGGPGGVVMEGRDISTVVFPHADLKIFLEADPEVRAGRRWRELQQRVERTDYPAVLADVRRRDSRDRGREASPLIRAADAVVVDNTAMDAEETARLIVFMAREKAKSAPE